MLWPVPALQATMYLYAKDEPEAVKSAADADCVVLINSAAESAATEIFLLMRIKTFLS